MHSANKVPLFHSRLGSPVSFFSSTPVLRSQSPKTVTIPKKKKCKKEKWLSEEGLQIAEKRREDKGKGERE